MGCIGITLLLVTAAFVAVSDGQCIRIRTGASQSSCGQPSCCPPPSCGPCPSCSPSSCGTSVEDLTTLLTIVRALEEKETPKSSISNAEEIILQLVNALVYATTHKSECSKETGTSIPPVGSINSSGTGGNIGGNNVVGGNNTSNTSNTGEKSNPGGTSKPNKEKKDNGLITLDLLQSGSDSNPDLEHLVRLGLAGKKILDVGLGGQDDSESGAQ